MTKQKTAKTRIKTRLQSFKMQLVSTVARAVFGKEMFFTSEPLNQTPAVAVFWYMDGGMRKFIMARQTSKTAQPAMFINTLENDCSRAMNEHLKDTVRQTLGTAFYKTLDPEALAADHISAAPCFQLSDTVTGVPHLVPTLVWVVPITTEQAHLAHCEAEGLEIAHLAEFSLLGNDVMPSHQMMYQAITRHLHKAKTPFPREEDMLQQLVDSMDNVPATKRTLH